MAACQIQDGREPRCWFLQALVPPMEASVVHRATLAETTVVLVVLVREAGAQGVFMGSPSGLHLATDRLRHSPGTRQDISSSSKSSRHTFQRPQRALENANESVRNPATVAKAPLNPNFPADLAHAREPSPHRLPPKFLPNILQGTRKARRSLRQAGVASNLDRNSIHRGTCSMAYLFYSTLLSFSD